MESERVYLGDWLFNAGIVGFIRIMLAGTDLDDQDMITLGDNYIEFDRRIMAGFAQKYFQTAFDQYGRYKALRESLRDWSEQLRPLVDKGSEPLSKEEVKKVKEIGKAIKNRTGFKLLKSKTSDVELSMDDAEGILSAALTIDKILVDNYQEFFESDVKIYAGKLYGQKNFLGRNVSKGMFEIFKKSFEDSLLNDACVKDKKYDCVCCGDRKAKKDVHFDTGLAPFLAANPDATNYAWNFISKFPLCDICELIYFCSFAGFTDFSTKYGNKTFYYVNKDSNIRDLYRANMLLMTLLDKNIDTNPVAQFFSELILKSEDRKALYTIQNTSFIKVDLKNSTFPSVFSYNISREKARLIHDHREDFETLAKASYGTKKDSFNVGIETMQKILSDTVDFLYVNRLLRTYLASERGNGNSKADFNTGHIQKVVWIIYDFIQNTFKREVDTIMESKELWHVYHKGLDLASAFRERDAENKISTTAYKLLNAVRAENTGTFMEILARAYLAYGIEMPSVFVKALSSKSDFSSLGYSFINGLLGKQFEKNTTGGSVNGK
jgi:CRISPR-associated protein Cst1